MHIEQAIRRATFLLAAYAVAACAGGGGGGLPVSAPSTATPSPTQNLVTTGGDAGSFAPVPAPLSAGVTLDGSNGMFPASGSFTVTYAARSAGGTPVSGHDGMAIFTSNGSTTSVQLVIPSLNISTTLVPDYAKGLAQQNRDPLDWGIDPVGGLTALTYMVLGPWFGNSVGNVPQLLFGIDTPVASMPVSGTATFTGFAQGFLDNTQFYPSVQGAASLSVDFATGSITGVLTKMQAYSPPVLPTQWNDVSISASIATGTSRFTGNTAVTSAPGALSLSPSAAGRIDGGFFGPAAQSLGAVWTLSDGTASAIGTISASH